ncbi:MAG: hypothetical protein FJY98_02740 [Candidatus Liptonbacteria bacterium]|nr:hypothetical protein [Candidatus Liptonbacteria bacterium]
MVLKTNLQKFLLPSIASLLILNVFVWHSVWKGLPDQNPSLHFLDVGQGDATLLKLPGNISILTDAGPDRKVVQAVNELLGLDRRYIDIGIITHPQRDHYGGFIDLLKHFKFGAIITNGRNADTGKEAWREFLATIQSENIPHIVLRAGDRIRYANNKIDFLSPGPNLLKSKELNDTSFVNRIQTPAFSALLTGDIGIKVEQFLLKSGISLKTDILKVAHHGSKFSSNKVFLNAANPQIALIGVGKNSYGHPTNEVLSRLRAASVGAVLRTDERGTVSIIPQGEKLLIFTHRAKGE